MSQRRCSSAASSSPPLGGTLFSPPSWHHDGLPRLRDMGAGRSAASERRCQHRDPLADRRLEAEAHVLPAASRRARVPTAGSSLSPRCSTRYNSRCPAHRRRFNYPTLAFAYNNRATNLNLSSLKTSIPLSTASCCPCSPLSRTSRDHVRDMTRRAITNKLLYHDAAHDGACRLCRAAHPAPAYREVAALRTVYAGLLRHVRLLSLHTANLNAIKAMGHSDIFLKLEIIKELVGIGLIFAAMNISVYAVCRRVSSSPGSFPSSSTRGRTVSCLGYKLTKQLRISCPRYCSPA